MGKEPTNPGCRFGFAPDIEKEVSWVPEHLFVSRASADYEEVCFKSQWFRLDSPATDSAGEGELEATEDPLLIVSS